MKKIITLILGIALVYGCSTNSDSNESSNSIGLLPKTYYSSSGETVNLYYNGNKIVSSGNENYTYNGNLIASSGYTNDPSINPNGYNQTQNYNYTNSILTSINYFSSMANYTITFTYNLDGSISENRTYSNGTVYEIYYKRYYSQGNCIKEEEFRRINGVWTLQYTTTSTFDNKNGPFNNILGFPELFRPRRGYKNNETGFIIKNGLGQITNTNQKTHIYNSENYPIQIASTTTNYSVNPQTGVSTPGIPTTENITITYY